MFYASIVILLPLCLISSLILYIIHNSTQKYKYLPKADCLTVSFILFLIFDSTKKNNSIFETCFQNKCELFN